MLCLDVKYFVNLLFLLRQIFQSIIFNILLIIMTYKIVNSLLTII
jgi:hypothetical protein